MAPPRTVNLPTQNELNRLLRYDKRTGQLFWKKRPRSMFTSMNAQKGWNVRFAGREAFTTVNKGYRRGMIRPVHVYAHQAIWKMMTGIDAPELDHIDGDKLNNTWRNLRLGSGANNQKNSPKRHDNTSGHVGVVRRGARWIAQFGANGTTKHIGIFDTFEEAVAARKVVEKAFGFHPNHGREAPILAPCPSGFPKRQESAAPVATSVQESSGRRRTFTKQ